MALITAAEARLYLPGLTGTAEDTALDTLILRAGRVMAAWCGYPPASAGGQPSMETLAYTRYYDAPSGRELVLDVWPVTAITSIEDDPTLTWNGTEYLVASADYTLIEGASGRLLLKNTATHAAWSEVEGALKVAFTAGWVTVPDAVKEACGFQVAHVWKDRPAIGASSVSQEGGSVQLHGFDLLPEVRTILEPYRLPRAVL